MPMTEKKSVPSKEMQNMAKKYFEFLKNGMIECRDLTGETLSEVILFAGDEISQLSVTVRAELMYRKLIPLDLKGLDIEQQLKLLLRDEWYGFTPDEIGELLKDIWKNFTPDMLLKLLRYHPTAFKQWPDWDWSAVADGTPEAWCFLLKRHYYYADHCPEEIWKRFSFEERCDLAAASPGLVTRLDLQSLPSQMQDAFLYENPLLAGCFNFAQDDPPGVLSLHFNYEMCYKKEVSATAEFLKKLLPYTYGHGMSAYNQLGIFSRTRGEVLQKEISSFLKKNHIPEISIYAEWNARPLPLVVPVDNLEARILLQSSRIVEACMEEEKLSRIDMLLTIEFETMRMDWVCLVLYKALSPELRRKAAAAMEKNGFSAEIIELVKSADLCGENRTRAKEEEQLLCALKAKDLSALNAAADRVYINALSVDEALKICRMLKASGVKKFFNRFLHPALRARLITELTEQESRREHIELVNILLRPYFREYLYEDFETFLADDF